MHEALISIKPTYVKMFLGGEKSVEIRNRTVKLRPGSRLWIYSTLPKGCIEAVAEVHCVVVGTPSEIWHQYSDSLAVTKSTYLRYVNGASTVSAILTKRVWRLPIEVDLPMLRSRVPMFHPPQFLKYMADSDPVFLSIVGFLCAGTNEDYLQMIGLTAKCARRANSRHCVCT
jgi:predicted transcriptional regulator